MNSPVPAFLPWATATAFVPIATATATPFPPAVLAQTGPVVYPSIYLPDLAIWVTCPSTVCNPIGSNSTFSLVDKSVTLYHDAVNFAARIAFGKSPTPAPVLNHAVPSVDAPTPTRKPHTQTVSAPDVQSAYLLPPGSYLLWSPWKEDPRVKWGYLYTVAQIRNKTWWALEKSGILAFTHKHCPVTHKSGPYIWYQGGPFVFEWIMLLGQLLWIVLLLLLMACLAMAGKAASLALLVKEFALDRRPWVLERVVRSPESVASAAGETISDLRNVGPWVIEHVARSTDVTSSIGEARSLLNYVGLWVLERVAQYTQYLTSFLTALTFRDYVQIATIMVLASVCKFLWDWESMLRSAFAHRDQQLNNLTGGFNMLHQYVGHWQDYWPDFRNDVQVHLEKLYGRSNAHTGEVKALWRWSSDANNVFCAHRDQVHAEHQVLHGQLDAHFGQINDLLENATDTNSRVDGLEKKNNMLEQLIIIIDGRLGAHRHAMLTMQQIIEARFSEVDERFEDVEAVAGEVETAVQGHHVDIRFIRDSIDAFKAHVEKQHGSLYEYFRITKALLDATDADVRVIRENVTGLTGQVSKAVQRICSLETLAKEAEELFKQQLAAVQGNITTINQRLTSGLEKLTITDKKATAAQTQIAGVTSKLRALQDCFATYNAWWADANTQFRTLLANIAKTNMAVATLRNTSTLHKDYILFLYSQVLPEFSRDALQTYTDTVVDAQPGAPLQVDVVLNERVQSALLRMLGEQMGPEASRAGSRTAPARDQQGDEALKPGPLRIRKKAPVGHAAEALTDRFLRELEAAQCGPSAGNE